MISIVIKKVRGQYHISVDNHPASHVVATEKAAEAEAHFIESNLRHHGLAASIRWARGAKKPRKAKAKAR